MNGLVAGWFVGGENPSNYRVLGLPLPIIFNASGQGTRLFPFRLPCFLCNARLHETQLNMTLIYLVKSLW